MSIRPVDMQVVIQKTTEMSRTSQIENQRPEIAQHNATEKVQKEAQLNEERVTNNENAAEQNAVNQDGKNGSGREQKSKRRLRIEEEKQEKGKNNTKNAGYDFSI